MHPDNLMASAESGGGGGVVIKKKFNKKAWRENKYSKKVRLDKWQEKRGLNIKRRYKKFRNKEERRRQNAGSANPNLIPLGSSGSNNEHGISEEGPVATDLDDAAAGGGRTEKLTGLKRKGRALSRSSRWQKKRERGSRRKMPKRKWRR